MAITKTSTAQWEGDLKGGKGTMTVGKGAYSFKSRFDEGENGTNPEELIAAAHAGCFSMALAFMLTGAGHAPEELRTNAKVRIEKVSDAWRVTGIALEVTGRVPGMAPAAFGDIAQKAKADCPISRLLASVPITLDAKLA